MITEFKIYEEKRTNHQVDDYVLMSGELLQSQKDKHIKILRILHFPTSGAYEHMYDNGEKGVSYYEYIKRYLTPKEINEFEINLATNKYNL